MSCTASVNSSDNRASYYTNRLFELAGFKDKDQNGKIEKESGWLFKNSQEYYVENADLDKNGVIEPVEAKYYLPRTVNYVASSKELADFKLTDRDRGELIDLSLKAAKQKGVELIILNQMEEDCLVGQMSLEIGRSIERALEFARGNWSELSRIALAADEIGVDLSDGESVESIMLEALDAANRLPDPRKKFYALLEITEDMVKARVSKNEVIAVFDQMIDSSKTDWEIVELAAREARVGYSDESAALADVLKDPAPRAAAFGRIAAEGARNKVAAGEVSDWFHEAFDSVAKIESEASRVYGYLSLAYSLTVGNQPADTINRALKTATDLVLALPKDSEAEKSERTRLFSMIDRQISKIQEIRPKFQAILFEAKAKR